MLESSNEEISIFLRDEETGRFVFNPAALLALGIEPTEAQQRGYPVKNQCEAQHADAPSLDPIVAGGVAAALLRFPRFAPGSPPVA